MTNTVLTAVGIIIASIASMVSAILTHLSRNALVENTTITTETRQHAEQIVERTDQIYQHTNSNLTRVKADLLLANDRIERLQKLVEIQLEKIEVLETKIGSRAKPAEEAL